MAVDLRRQLAEQARRILAGKNPMDDLNLTVEEIMLSVDQVFAEIIKQSYYENKQNEDDFFLSGVFIYPFILDVQCDDLRKKLYITLPSVFAGLPGNLGIQQVGFVDESETFPVVPSNFQAMSKGLIVSRMDGRICCFSEGNKVFILNVKSENKPEKLLVKLACGTMGSLDQPIDIPLDCQNHIINALVQRYTQMEQMPEDNVNNNVQN